MDINRIYCEDCRDTMLNHIGKATVDCILTSPPYNTSRKGATDLKTHQCRYEDFNDSKSDKEYVDWTCELFRGFDNVLKDNGVVLYNVSYSSENTWMIWDLISDIQRNTNFMVADCIVWKKKSALPNNTSQNKLTRICEFVFVFCKRDSFMTFNCYKGISSQRDNGQTMYNNVFNFIEAPNNDGSCDIHKATFSSLLVRQLLLLYTNRGGLFTTPSWERVQLLLDA